LGIGWSGIVVRSGGRLGINAAAAADAVPMMTMMMMQWMDTHTAPPVCEDACRAIAV
jgi:hypothetical protein